MPISNAAFVRSTVVLLIAGMLALLGIVGTSLWLVNKVQDYFTGFIEVRTACTTELGGEAGPLDVRVTTGRQRL